MLLTTQARRRLINDYKKLQQEKDLSLYAFPKSNSVLEWEAVLLGPDNSAWEGGVFKLTLNFSEEYPNKPPEVQFMNGKICLDILNSAWSPIYDVSAVLKSIRSLLTDPNIDSPANSEAAKYFSEDIVFYNQKVEESVLKSLEVPALEY